MFTGNESALSVAGQTIGLIGGLVKQATALRGRPLHPAIVANITKDQVPLFMPPHRPFSRPTLSAKTAGQFLDLLVDLDNAI
jgi:hypothetical protein